MTQNTLSPDDPRLTAYALGEMEAAERVEFETLLQADPAAQQVVAEIRATGVALAAALEQEAGPVEAKPHAKAAIVPGGTGPVLDGGGTLAEQTKRAKEALNRPIRFPQFYYLVSGLAAACFAVFFVYWQRHQPPPPRTYLEVDLAKFKPAEPTQATEAAVAPAPQPAVTMALAPKQEEVVVLQPSQTEGSADSGYMSAVTLSGGGRLRTELAEHSAAASAADSGYAAATTLAGNRLNTELRDIGNAVSVSREQFAADTSATGRDIGQVEVRAGAADFYAAAHAAQKRSEEQAAVARAARDSRERQMSAQALMTFAAPPEPDLNTEAYGFRKDNDYQRVADHPLSTFSIDVDTAAYANVRRFLTQGQRPPADAVRIEELVNYFPYHYAPPADGTPFAASLEVAAAPWKPEHRLVRIGLKGREVSDAARPAANLVFLLDVSGSMRAANKLPLVKQSLRLLVDKLRPDDRVAIAVYAGSSGLALPSTPAGRKADILAAIDRLEAGGSTNGALGIHLAYDVAKANLVAGGINRVILATDGDFNVGTTSEGELVRLVGEKAQAGVFLTVLGFGMGNLQDGTLEQIADRGNGHYAYIDSLAEARKTLVEQAGGTLLTIAKDVKIQVEFNPAQVAAYRLIGYENRMLAKEDFNNDRVDAGEIGAGHTVTALYEVVPAGAELPTETPAVDELKYQKVETPNARRQGASSPELLTVKVRYKEPAGDTSRRLDFPLRDAGARFEDASQDFKFAAAVAAFGMALRDAPHRGSLTLADVSAWARAGLGSDAGGHRSEFLGLVEQARPLLQ